MEPPQVPSVEMYMAHISIGQSPHRDGMIEGVFFMLLIMCIRHRARSTQSRKPNEKKMARCQRNVRGYVRDSGPRGLRTGQAGHGPGEIGSQEGVRVPPERMRPLVAGSGQRFLHPLAEGDAIRVVASELPVPDT